LQALDTLAEPRRVRPEILLLLVVADVAAHVPVLSPTDGALHRAAADLEHRVILQPVEEVAVGVLNAQR
jgi:hypothetical protein